MAIPVIALLTDFGARDGFVGVLKGVIYSLIHESPQIVDIAHDIPFQDIRSAAWVLKNSWPHFPALSIFVCVVDPRVGDPAQRKLLLHWEERQLFFIAPDNGLLTPVIQQAAEEGHPLIAYDITNPALARTTPEEISRTFHGRDVYAPAAAHLANALAADSLGTFLVGVGPKIDSLVCFEVTPAVNGDMINGCVEYSDVFGNLITNIPNNWVRQGQDMEIQVADQPGWWQCTVARTYAMGEALEQPFLVPGSDGMLELALYKRSAQQLLRVNVGDAIRIQKPAS